MRGVLNLIFDLILVLNSWYMYCQQHDERGIEVGELRRELEDEGLLDHISPARMNQLLDKADRDADALITYKEFERMVSILFLLRLCQLD